MDALGVNARSSKNRSAHEKFWQVFEATKCSDWCELEASVDARKMCTPIAPLREYVLKEATPNPGHKHCATDGNDSDEDLAHDALYIQVGSGHVRLATLHNIPTA